MLVVRDYHLDTYMTAVAACELGLCSITTRIGKDPVSIPKSAEHKNESQNNQKLYIKFTFHCIFPRTNAPLFLHLPSAI